MKIFIAFRFTGEDPKELDKTLTAICDRLKSQGHECLCTLWDEDMFQQNGYGHKQIMDHGLKYLNAADTVLALVTSNEKSEGMLVEIGYAMAKGKKIVLALKQGCQSRFVQSIAEKTIEFESLDDLVSKLNI